MKKLPKLPLALMLGLAAVSVFTRPSCCAAAKVLRWRLEPEQKYRVVVSWTSQSIVAGLDVSNSTLCDLVWTVRSVDAEGHYEIAQTLTHVKQSLQNPDGALFQYDSQAAGEVKGTNAFLAAYWKPLLSVERIFKMSPQGKVQEVEEANLWMPTENALISRVFGRDAWRDALRQGSVILPTEGLEPMQAWTEPQTVPLPGDASNLTVTRSYTYEGERQKNEAEADTNFDVIKVTNRFEIEADEEKPSPIRILQQSGSGEIIFDGAVGRLVSSQLNQTLKLRYESADGELDSQLTTSLEATFQPLPKPEETAGDAPPPVAPETP